MLTRYWLMKSSDEYQQKQQNKSNKQDLNLDFIFFR